VTYQGVYRRHVVSYLDAFVASLQSLYRTRRISRLYDALKVRSSDIHFGANPTLCEVITNSLLGTFEAADALLCYSKISRLQLAFLGLVAPCM
jgi:hypothetical protein